MAYKDVEKRRAYDRAWYHKQSIDWKEKKQTSAASRKKEVAKLVAEYKENKGCSNCPETNPVCLDLHHEQDKEIEIANAVNLGS